MHFFEQIVQKLFPSSPNDGTPVSILQEVLERSPQEKKNYEAWLQDKKYTALIQDIAQAYYYKKTQITGSIQVHLFQDQSAKGLAVSYHAHFGKKNFQHLFDYWKDQVLGLGYQLKSKTHQITDHHQYIESKQRYFLKPPRRLEQGKYPQLYGNVLLEHISIDDKPSYIKVLVATYTDRLFTPALDFEDFMENIFSLG